MENFMKQTIFVGSICLAVIYAIFCYLFTATLPYTPIEAAIRVGAIYGIVGLLILFIVGLALLAERIFPEKDES